MDHITLACREGGSDKIYQLFLFQDDGAWHIDYANARRGGNLARKTKARDLSEDAARKLYDKTVREKLAKGYRPEGAQAEYTVSDDGNSGVLPMLLNAIDDPEPWIQHPRWCLQEKIDGERRLVERKDGVLRGINRRGQYVSVPQVWSDQLPQHDFLLDGETVGDILHVFDVLEYDGADLRPDPYNWRLGQLYTSALEGLSNITIVNTFSDTEVKRYFLDVLRERGAEGVVFKSLDAAYTPGRPNSGGEALKFKFYETASVEVIGINVQRSVAVAVWDRGIRVPVGNVTVPANQPIPQVGDIIEVRYLYYYPGGSLYQPTLLGIRSDIDASECVIEQLKAKAGSDA